MRTVDVRIMVGVRDDGEWSSAGWSHAKSNDPYHEHIIDEDLYCDEDRNVSLHWVAVTLPVPEPVVYAEHRGQVVCCGSDDLIDTHRK